MVHPLTKAQGRGALFVGHVVLPAQQFLKEQVILPFSGDLEVLLRNSDRLETIVSQHRLRATVVQERTGLEPVQVEVVAAVCNKLAESRRGKALTGMVLVDPVAQTRGLKRTPYDAGQGHLADDGVTFGYHERIAGSRGKLQQLSLQNSRLALEREEGLVALRLPGCKMLAVAPLGVEDWSDIGQCQKTQGRVGGQAYGVEHPSIVA